MPWFCAQIGAREHYAVPRALHQSGRLTALHTDFWAGPATRVTACKWKLGALRSLAARYHPELGGGDQKAESGNLQAEIISWNLRSFYWELLRRRKSARQTAYHGFTEVGRRFAIRVREGLKRRTNLSADTILYAYDTGALEAFESCRERGIKCILNQMDPNRVEVDLVRAEGKKWPGWEQRAVQVPEEYFVRREQEWALADRVVVNSEFCRQALIKQGVPSAKLVVIPLCYESEDRRSKFEGRSSEIDHGPISKPLRVLFLGQVILRKGIQYLMAAARQLEWENIQFDIVGPVGISPAAMASAPQNLTFHGRIGRGQAANWYRQSDLFVLPTLSDGFAITQLEAMAHGLPVVTTPCCGEVVSDGNDGFIVPPRDSEALLRTFQRYLAEPELLRSHQEAARIKAQQFTLERLAQNLLRLETALR